MNKTIITKQMRRWQIIDRLVLMLPVLVFLYILFGETAGRYLLKTVMTNPSPKVIGAAFVILAVASVFLSVPLFLICRAVSHGVKKAIIRNATFHTIQDLDYYREKLTNIPPTTISLLVDLKIETKKDVAALLLKYVKMGAVSMEDGTIRVLNRELSGLLQSDQTLLTLIMKGEVQPANLAGWKQQVIAEAIQSNHLKQMGAEARLGSVSLSCLGGCLSGCLLPIILCIAVALSSFAVVKSGILDRIDLYFDAMPNAIGLQEQINYLMTSPEMITSAALLILLLFPMFAAFFLPLAGFLRILSSVAFENHRIGRTETGELLAAQISGLKNFIRDYSNLSMADKEQLLLWDDFLIYAVVMEENERIIEDIFHLKNLRYQDYIIF